MSFASAACFSVGRNSQAVASADFNSDGRLDLALADGTVRVLLGNGDGTFQQPAMTSGPVGLAGPNTTRRLAAPGRAKSGWRGRTLDIHIPK